ncbi:MAG: response regulator, partial [Synergistaceae bacterium]|nr:response regulator [Synergistaceae bacterium]
MYKVFFVDDEAAMRAGLRDSINWDNSDFVLTGEAPDGEMALSMIAETLPDILITDVRMPFMDGIELSLRVSRIMPWVKIIILSGHDEFEYAKQAIKIGVTEYLLKPVTSETMFQALEGAAREIESEREGRRAIE